MKKTPIIAGAGVVTLSAIITLMTSFSPTSANDQGFGRMGHGFKMEHRQEFVEAIEAGDFEAFQKLSENMPFADQVTAENFPKVQELYTAMQNKDFEKVKQLSEELGFKPGVKGAEMGAKKAAMDAALESRDFATWQAAVKEQNPESDVLTKITAENFPRFLELHDLRKEAQELHAEMKVISDELGIKPERQMMKKGFGHGKFGRGK